MVERAFDTKMYTDYAKRAIVWRDLSVFIHPYVDDCKSLAYILHMCYKCWMCVLGAYGWVESKSREEKKNHLCLFSVCVVSYFVYFFHPSSFSFCRSTTPPPPLSLPLALIFFLQIKYVIQHKAE